MINTVYSANTIRTLEAVFDKQKIHRRFRRRRYEPGTILEYDVRGIIPDGRAHARLEILKFVGGGYAGQVYKVKLLALDPVDGTVRGLEPGRIYALKILVPASGFGRKIRDLLYGLGFQAPFSLQSLASAGRSQALWQTFIRRAARNEFGRDDTVVEILGTVLDRNLGSYGEINEWIDGRMWRFEVDDDLDARRHWKVGQPGRDVGSPEYRAKKTFMRRLVRLLHDIGATELARQYEWWSLKSQPNALKRTSSDPDPEAGLVAVDFRAGMTLLPFLPQCPADFKLIVQGLLRGRLVQFDKGDLKKLEHYVEEHWGEFHDLRDALDELKREDKAYRDSLIDVTCHHVRPLGNRLRRAIFRGFRESWRVRNITDDKTAVFLKRSDVLALLFLLVPHLAWTTPALFIFAFPGRVWWKYPLWLAPLVLAPFLRRLWGRADFRRHLGAKLTSPSYLVRSIRGRIAEAMIRWVRTGRSSEARAVRISARPFLNYLNLPLAWLPAGFHRFLTDKAVFKERLQAMFVQPVRLLIHSAERERWLLDMVAQGRRSGLLGEAEEALISGQVKEPYIQKYLKSLAVHLATLFVSETVFLTAAIVYVLTHPELSWQAATLRAGVIIGALNLLPISPGSLVRGFYVIGLMIKERNFKDYNIAFGVSFLKVVGYLAFPIQMAYRYPDLARFMAGHWANEAVHRVPIFGEKGAWLEHFVFDTFYNFPLTIRRRIKVRAERRAGKTSRNWPSLFIAAGGVGVLGGIGFGFARLAGGSPEFGRDWWLAIWVPLAAGMVTALTAGGMAMGRRVIRGMLVGAGIGLMTGIAPFIQGLGLFFGTAVLAADVSLGLAIARSGVGLLLLFGVLGLIGAAISETRRP